MPAARLTHTVPMLPLHSAVHCTARAVATAAVGTTPSARAGILALLSVKPLQVRHITGLCAVLCARLVAQLVAVLRARLVAKVVVGAEAAAAAAVVRHALRPLLLLLLPLRLLLAMVSLARQ